MEGQWRNAMHFTIDNVEVTSNLTDLTEDEVRKYIRYVDENKTDDIPLEKLEVKLCDDGKIDVNYTLQGRKFERIRRITGYLTGDLSSWNNAKRAEESERVKHNVGDEYE